MKPLITVPAYEKFLLDRDQGLERVLAKYSRAMSHIVLALKLRSEEVASHFAVTGIHKDQLKRARIHFEDHVRPYFEMAIQRAEALTLSMRKTVYLISAAGQSHAIARTLDRKTTLSISKDEIRDVLKDESHLGGPVGLRCELSFHRLLRDVVDAFQLSQVMSSTPQETIERIGRSFPRFEKVKARRNVMAKLKESFAPKEPEVEISEFGIDAADWEAAVQDYLSTEIPQGRAPYDKIFDDASDTPEYFQRSRWEVEQELTNDFVDQVRSGENEAASQAGIDDFQWIAIVDSKTDECCFERDGLTMTEIDETVKDEFDGPPPIHPNCRCRLAPMVKEMPEESAPDFGSFDSWLANKAVQQ